jgi:hypothetical protein
MSAATFNMMLMRIFEGLSSPMEDQTEVTRMYYQYCNTFVLNVVDGLCIDDVIVNNVESEIELKRKITLLEDSTLILWYWSVTVSHEMSSNTAIWLSLRRLVSIGIYTPSDPFNKCTKIRRHVAAIIERLVSASVVSRPDGVQKFESTGSAHQEQPWLLSTLIDCIQTETDEDCIRRHLRTIRCFLGCDTGNSGSILTLSDLLQCQGISFSTLLKVLVSVLQQKKKQLFDIDSRIQACEILAYMLPLATKREKKSLGALWPIIETTLVQTIADDDDSQSIASSITATTNYDNDIIQPLSASGVMSVCSLQNEENTCCDKLVQSACHALTECIKHSPWDRGGNILSNDVFERLISVIQNQSTSNKIGIYLDQFSNFLLHLVRSIYIIDESGNEYNINFVKGNLSSKSKSEFLVMLASSTSVTDLVTLLLKSASNDYNSDPSLWRSTLTNVVMFLQELIFVNGTDLDIGDNRTTSTSNECQFSSIISSSTALSIRKILARNDRLLVSLADICVMNIGKDDITKSKDIIHNISVKLLLTLIPEI